MFVNGETEAPDHKFILFFFFPPVLRQKRTSQEPSLKPLLVTSVQINTERRSTVAADELEGKKAHGCKAAPTPDPSWPLKARLTPAQDFTPD